MALPKISVPTYDLTIPSTKEKIKVRPFSVKEEKLLLIALESENMGEIADTVKQVINNCIIKGEVDVDKLPFFDIDYMFIFLRAKSIGESVEVKMTCNNVVDGEKCGEIFEAAMDISKCDINYAENVVDEIKLDKDKGVKMKFPTYAAMRKIEANPVDAKTDLIIQSIDYIFDKKGVYPARDHSKEELTEFVEGLTEANYKKMESFVNNAPTFAVRLQHKCPKCGFNHDVRYTEFYDFFF